MIWIIIISAAPVIYTVPLMHSFFGKKGFWNYFILGFSIFATQALCRIFFTPEISTTTTQIVYPIIMYFFITKDWGDAICSIATFYFSGILLESSTALPLVLTCSLITNQTPTEFLSHIEFLTVAETIVHLSGTLLFVVIFHINKLYHRLVSNYKYPFIIVSLNFYLVLVLNKLLTIPQLKQPIFFLSITIVYSILVIYVAYNFFINEKRSDILDANLAIEQAISKNISDIIKVQKQYPKVSKLGNNWIDECILVNNDQLSSYFLAKHVDFYEYGLEFSIDCKKDLSITNEESKSIIYLIESLLQSKPNKMNLQIYENQGNLVLESYSTTHKNKLAFIDRIFCILNKIKCSKADNKYIFKIRRKFET